MSLLFNRVAFTIFGQEIYWYGIIIASAIAVMFLLSFLLPAKKGLQKDLPIDIFLAIIPLGILSARLFSVLFDEGQTILDYFNFRDGGLSIIGAIIGGVAGICILCKVKKLHFLDIADIIVPCLILGQAIGRWGNFLNVEVYGLEIINPAWQFFPVAITDGGKWFMALFFYEFVLDLIGAIILFIAYFKTKKRGVCTGIYLCYYGAVRLVLESLRLDEFVLKLGVLPISQVISGLFLVAGIALLIFINVRKTSDGKRGNANK